MKLSLRTREPAPHEIASSGAAIAVEDNLLPRGSVRIELSDGSQRTVKASVVALHSPFFATLLSSSGSWREESTADTWDVSLHLHDPLVVRQLLDWMEASPGRPKREAARLLCSPEGVVEAARLSHYLEVSPLLTASVATISEALDAANAPSILLLARELNMAELEEKAMRFIIIELNAVEAEGEYWAELPKLTRETLRALREATLRNPLLSESGASGVATISSSASCSGRELLAMVRESLAELKERFTEAMQRHAAEVKLAEVPRDPARGVAFDETTLRPESRCHSKAHQRMAGVLDTQGERIRALEAYLQKQEAAFVALLDQQQPQPSTPTKQAAAAASSSSNPSPTATHQLLPAAASSSHYTPFIPSYDWQWLPEGEGVSVPPGLEIVLPLDGESLRRARIPPNWRLRVWVDEPLNGFWRIDVRRETTMGELNDAASEAIGEKAFLQFGMTGTVFNNFRRHQTVEQVMLWQRRAEVRVMPEAFYNDE